MQKSNVSCCSQCMSLHLLQLTLIAEWILPFEIVLVCLKEVCYYYYFFVHEKYC